MRDVFEEMAALRADIKQLRAEVKDVRDALIFESKSNAEQIVNIYSRLTEHSELMYPILRKVFPNMAAEQRDALAWVKRQPKE